MKTLSFHLGFVALSLLFVSNSAFAQGSLPPPGAPAPTMKSLDQIEPRTPISSLPFSISNPGSYYVVTNLNAVASQNGISISSDDVTIDLNGFALRGVGGVGDGIIVTGGSHRNVVIRNGSVIGWVRDGVSAEFAFSSQFEHLQLSGNGNAGLFTGRHCVVKDCKVIGNTYGMSVNAGSVVSDCTASTNTQGILPANGPCVFQRCTANGNLGDGFSSSGNLFIDCAAGNNVGNGFNGGPNTFIGCLAVSNTNGFKATSGAVIKNCTASSNVRAGISLSSNRNHVEGNFVRDNGRGIEVTAAGNLIIRNTAAGNSVNYDIIAANKVGVIVSAPDSGAIFGSTGGAGVGTTDPWANISF